jgi:hypothetical protein
LQLDKVEVKLRFISVDVNQGHSVQGVYF